MTTPINTLKSQARNLRTSLARTGHDISHAQSLELIAGQQGYRDWNTLHAATANAAPQPYAVGQSVTGRYLGTPFRGAIHAVQGMAANSRFRLTIRFDAPLNVSKFDSMELLRRQINAVVAADGTTATRTSDGQPHLVLDR